ncbi:MAG: hypothetical protein F4164_01375 [Gemmatimonadales bacterium]|nr:hypothetical protein [Gemmatimonadales bacterium]MYG48027.1 hypothetical protein [Gemmatimonadales bacterium]MYK01566.1 hypothetical protein [Candidatus Palauibacter ramosifaciens]
MPEVFFHVGAGRAASRWLQERVFPHFRGVRYVPRTRFRQSAKVVRRGGDLPVLVSRQLGYRELTPAVEWFARLAPAARPILILRRHDKWLRSVYLREIKELRYVPFETFIDLERDEGVRPRSSARFRDRIRVLEDHFEHRPLVLFFDRLVADPGGFVRTIADYVGASYDEARISFRPSNRSYRDRQYRFLREVGRHWPAKRREEPASAALRWLRVRSRRLAWHAGVALGRVAPERILRPDPLLTEEQLACARAFYEADWEACVDYARRHNPGLGAGG